MSDCETKDFIAKTVDQLLYLSLKALAETGFLKMRKQVAQRATIAHLRTSKYF